MFDSFHHSCSRLFTFHRSLVYTFAPLTAVRIALVQWPLLGLISFPFFQARVKSLFVSSPIHVFFSRRSVLTHITGEKGKLVQDVQVALQVIDLYCVAPSALFFFPSNFQISFFIFVFYSRFSNFVSIILYFHSVISLIFYILRLIQYRFFQNI